MRWLVAGSRGMLGRDLLEVLETHGEPVTGVDLADIDITDPAGTAGVAGGYDVVVNCAAYTAVDRAEEEEPAAFAVNALGAANLARSAHVAGARMVQISTDYVFDGDAQVPYPADAALNPRSAYGRTKAAGEWAVRAECREHLIVRTAWLYGEHGPCFPRTIARLARERGTLDVVADQVGQPTWTVDLADLVVRLVLAGVPSGTYHGTASGQTSWHGFARAVVAAAGLDADVVRPTTSSDLVRAAARPAYSVLAHDSVRTAGAAPIGPWDERWGQAAGMVLA